MRKELILVSPIFEKPEDSQDCIVVDEFDTWLILAYDKNEKVFYDRYKEEIIIPEDSVKYWAELPSITN